MVSTLLHGLLFILCVALLLIGVPFIVHAQSVVWSANVPDLASLNQSTGECIPRIRSAYASIQYAAQAVDQSGSNMCGGTIAKGTQITFRPRPYSSSDIYWFGTGYYGDSPYGDWKANAAAPAPANICDAKNYYSSVVDTSRGSTLIDFYGSFSVNPPASSVSGFGSIFTCGSAASDGSVACTASSEGSADVMFSFGSTYGHFYATDPQEHNQCSVQSGYEVAALQYPAGNWYNAGGGRGWYICPGAAENGPYTLTVPAQSISCRVTVINPNGNPPHNPNISGTSISGSHQCIVGTPYTLTFSSTDSDGDQLRYGVDWDNSGTVDQFVPPSGYVASGLTQTASRTFAVDGQKTVGIIAMDSRGLTSGWATYSFNCIEQSDPDLGGGNGGDGSGNANGGSESASLLIRATPSLVRSGDTTTISWSASSVLGSTCKVTSGTDPLATGTGDWTGAISSVTSSPITHQTTYTLSCTGLDDAVLTQSATVNILPVFQEL